MDLLDDIGQKLIDDGLVEGTTGWKLFKSYSPPDPDQCVMIYEMPGPEPDQTQGIAYEYPGFQIFVRAAEFEYDVARTKIKEIFNSLNNADISGYVYVYASDSGPLLDVYGKQDNRPTLFWSFNTMKSPNPMVVMGTADMTAGGGTPTADAAFDSGNISITVPSAQIGAVGH